VSRLVLIVVAAAWAAVLLPPLLRSRMESRPDTSVSSFRRQLTSLQRSTPAMSPMRSMARPLAGSPRPGQLQRPMQQVRRSSVGTVSRYDLAADRRSGRAHYAAPIRPVSTAKQRRQNILMGLGLATLGISMLVVQLEQSPYLNIFPEERARETLKLMERPPDEKITREIGRETRGRRLHVRPMHQRDHRDHPPREDEEGERAGQGTRQGPAQGHLRLVYRSFDGLGAGPGQTWARPSQPHGLP